MVISKFSLERLESTAYSRTLYLQNYSAGYTWLAVFHILLKDYSKCAGQNEAEECRACT